MFRRSEETPSVRDSTVAPLKSAPPLDEASIRKLLDRLAMTEAASSEEVPEMTPLRLSPLRDLKGFKEPVAGSPDTFWFRVNLRGGLGALNHTASHLSGNYVLPLGAFIDPIILQYYQLNGAYQFKIQEVDCELNFVPNTSVSGMAFFKAIAQTPAVVNLVLPIDANSMFKLQPGPSAYPIGVDLNTPFATLDVDLVDARTTDIPSATAAAWLSINAMVRFDGFNPVAAPKKRSD